MEYNRHRKLATALAFSVLSTTTGAESTPPIKPGLWQAFSAAETDGKKAPDPSEMLKSLPPEAREKIASMMKEKGIDAAQDGSIKICHTRESLQDGLWGKSTEGCKTDITSRSDSKWTWHSSCTQPRQTEMDGEISFSNSENYTVKTVLKMAQEGQSHTTKRTVTAKWLGSDCGNLKPLQPSATTSGGR